MIVGSRVEKIEGVNRGEKGVVIESAVGPPHRVKVKPDNPGFTWKTQAASNFILLKDEEEEAKVTSPIAKTKGRNKTKEMGESAPHVEKKLRSLEKQPSAQQNANKSGKDSTYKFRIGDQVRKVDGSSSGQTGVVFEMSEAEGVEGKLKIKVKRDEGDGYWNMQASSNYILLQVDGKEIASHDSRTEGIMKAKEKDRAVPEVESKPGSEQITTKRTPPKAKECEKQQQVDAKDQRDVVMKDNVESNEVYAKDTTISTVSAKLAAIDLRSEEGKVEWNTSRDTPFPPEFTKKSLVEMPEELQGGGVMWRGQQFAAAEWRAKLQLWEIRYPNIAIKEGKLTKTTHETCTHRCAQTTNKMTIQYCWDSLPQSHHCIASKYKDKYRVDMYGNVVSIEASDGALCKFDVDHIFPWSRGGRSVNSNFVACQYDANRRVKNDALVQSLRAEDMACGLSPEQFKALMTYAEVKGGRSRRDVTWAKDKVEQWLLQGPRKGFSLGNFRNDVNGTVDGEVLWSFFSAHAARQEAEMIAGEVKVVTSAMANVNIAASVTKPLALPRPATVNMRRTSTCLECYGTSTYQIQEVFRRNGMTWDGEDHRKCWWKSIVGLSAQEIARLWDEISAACLDVGIQVSDRSGEKMR